MAKKKSSQRNLTDEQYTLLGDKLSNTTENVYTLAKSMFQLDFTEADWKGLEEKTGLFRCHECNQWLDKKQEGDRKVSGLCTNCVDEINGEPEDPEDD